MSGYKTAGLTSFAMLAFAANSVLCRLALADAQITPLTFTQLRLAAGALVLLLLVRFGRRAADAPRFRFSWRALGAPAALVLYAAPFSLAYVELEAGTGALVLFACVQLTMLIAAVVQGERPRPLQWAGLLLALAGLVYLLLPGAGAPPLGAAVVMAVAGVAWGAYTLLGRGSADPVRVTATNFVGATLLVLLPWLAVEGLSGASALGVGLAVASGALASGVGYAVWYAALPHLSAMRAAVVQLIVPALASAFGVAFMGEQLTLRLVLATALILGGVALALVIRERPRA